MSGVQNLSPAVSATSDVRYRQYFTDNDSYLSCTFYCLTISEALFYIKQYSISDRKLNLNQSRISRIHSQLFRSKVVESHKAIRLQMEIHALANEFQQLPSFTFVAWQCTSFKPQIYAHINRPEMIRFRRIEPKTTASLARRDSQCQQLATFDLNKWDFKATVGLPSLKSIEHAFVT